MKCWMLPGNLHQHLTPELQAKHADLIAQIEISVLSNFMMLAAHSHEWARLQKFSDDMSKAGHYARNIRHTADKHTAVLDDMKSLEVEMDRHWTYLEGRLAGLNMAGKLIEQCSIRSFNQLAATPEWQRLEWQNQRLLDAPKSKHGIHLASINAEKTATDSSPTANKAIIPSAPPARANRTTRSFQAY